MKINCKVNSKTDPIISHKYELQFADNLKEEPKDRIWCMVKSLRMKDTQKNTFSTIDGSTSISIEDLFLSQVTEIHNVYNPAIERDMTVEEIALSSVNPVLMAIMADVVNHLTGEMYLNGEERKN